MIFILLTVASVDNGRPEVQRVQGSTGFVERVDKRGKSVLGGV